MIKMIHANASYLYSLKTSENEGVLTFSEGIEMG